MSHSSAPFRSSLAPGDWLDHPIAVDGLALPQGRLGWRCDGRRVNLTLTGRPPDESRLAPSFPPNTEIAWQNAAAKRR